MPVEPGRARWIGKGLTAREESEGRLMNFKKTRALAITPLLVVLSLVLSVVPARAVATGYTTGIVTLSGAIGTCGTFTYDDVSSTVVINGIPYLSVVASGSYCNPEILTGVASGSATASRPLIGVGEQSCAFSWARTGAAAIISLEAPCDSTWAALFSPAYFVAWGPASQPRLAR